LYIKLEFRAITNNDRMRDMADVFAVQEEIAERVVVSIKPAIQRAEKERAQRLRPENLGAWDYALRRWRCMSA
jgi:hypothetical protein